jgi:2-polyprenyl-3-methyl-5-hydroxy-6-metoxy-1,4-benzoquinol methylase
LGGGTGEDGVFMATRGYQVTITDGAPAMLEMARAKASAAGLAEPVVRVEHLVLEHISEYAAQGRQRRFDGVYSNFASLNCVENLADLAAPLGGLVRPGGVAALVLFGP